jgi:hypothetical protein
VPFSATASGTQSSWSKGCVSANNWYCFYECICNLNWPVELYICGWQIQERVRAKGREGFNRPKTGSVAAFKVSFREWVVA